MSVPQSGGKARTRGTIAWVDVPMMGSLCFDWGGTRSAMHGVCTDVQGWQDLNAASPSVARGCCVFRCAELKREGIEKEKAVNKKEAWIVYQNSLKIRAKRRTDKSAGKI